MKEINSKLVETSLDVVSDTFIDTHSKTGVSSGTIVKCSYKNVCPREINGTPAGVVYSDKVKLSIGYDLNMRYIFLAFL